MKLTANKTSVLQNQLFLLLLGSEVRKRVDNYTKNEIKYNNDDNEEE